MQSNVAVVVFHSNTHSHLVSHPTTMVAALHLFNVVVLSLLPPVLALNLFSFVALSPPPPATAFRSNIRCHLVSQSTVVAAALNLFSVVILPSLPPVATLNLFIVIALSPPPPDVMAAALKLFNATALSSLPPAVVAVALNLFPPASDCHHHCFPLPPLIPTTSHPISRLQPTLPPSSLITALPIVTRSYFLLCYYSNPHLSLAAQRHYFQPSTACSHATSRSLLYYYRSFLNRCFPYLPLPSRVASAHPSSTSVSQQDLIQIPLVAIL
ncbi:hypothetical protein GW17_00019849 [Ensete ventricosum]|nr:hypothetical protein GW17_00019849 [Ensete ventricosum]RZS00708.1 hypothetical protein BHM03_00030466 [Ensete ventricosum]